MKPQFPGFTNTQPIQPPKYGKPQMPGGNYQAQPIQKPAQPVQPPMQSLQPPQYTTQPVNPPQGSLTKPPMQNGQQGRYTTMPIGKRQNLAKLMWGR